PRRLNVNSSVRESERPRRARVRVYESGTSALEYGVTRPSMVIVTGPVSSAWRWMWSKPPQPSSAADRSNRAVVARKRSTFSRLVFPEPFGPIRMFSGVSRTSTFFSERKLRALIRAISGVMPSAARQEASRAEATARQTQSRRVESRAGDSWGFRAAAAGGGGGAPGGEVGQRLVDVGGAGGQLLGAERGRAEAVGLVDLGVPLLPPGLGVGQPGGQGGEPVVVPAVGLAGGDDQ